MMKKTKYKKRTTYQAGDRYFYKLEDARAYALTFPLGTGISRNGEHIGDVKTYPPRWIKIDRSKPSKVGALTNGRHVVYVPVESVYQLYPNGRIGKKIR